MENLALPRWTLSASVDGPSLEFWLGDGRRLSLHASRPAKWLEWPDRRLAAEDLLGRALAAQLASSAPRPLSLLYAGDSAIDRIDWEHLDLAGAPLAARFHLGRELRSELDAPLAPASPGATPLAVVVVHGAVAGAQASGRRVAFESLDERDAGEAVAGAHVLVLDDVPLSAFVERADWPRRPCLMVLTQPVSTRRLGRVLDAGAAVLHLADPRDLGGPVLQALLQHLAHGMALGEAVCWLHRRAASEGLVARLYGDPLIRFVLPPAPGSRRQVTSLSVDIVGSTRMIEALGEEAYAARRREVQARCTRVVNRHGGQSDDWQGDDGGMCYFGHVTAAEDAAVHAVAAGLEIVQGVAEIGAEVRVGITTARVTVIAGLPHGLPVHHAARWREMAAPGTVLVSAVTGDLVAHAFELERVAQRPSLQDIESSETVFRVLRPSRDAWKHPLERLPVLAPLVGREVELERLRACWRATQSEGANRLVVINGEAGMGKSRLVREFRQQLAEPDVRVLECRCREDAKTSPFLTLAEALRRWLDIGQDDDAEVALRKLADSVPRHVPRTESFALLGPLLGITKPANAGPANSRQRLMVLLVDWFLAFACDRPCCLIVEDWHWIDPSMREFVEQLAQRRGRSGLLVVVTARDGITAPQPPSAPHERIGLAKLPPEAACALVAHVSADKALPAGLVATLLERGDGIPLFIEETTRAVVLRLAADGALDDLEGRELVPPSLVALLTARLDNLAEARPVALVATVLGRQFSRAWLAALLDADGQAMEPAELDRRLAELVESGLVRAEHGGEFVFRHALLRDEAYELLLDSRREALHGHVVGLLQRRWPDVAASQPELLAQHQEHAGMHLQAVAQWELAAGQAASRSAQLEAVSHLRRALSSLKHLEQGVGRDRTRLRLLLRLAAGLMATEGYGADAAHDAYIKAQRLCIDVGDDTSRFKVEMGLEAYHFMRAEFALALEHDRRAAEIAARSGDIKQRLQAHWGLACSLFHQGELRATMREMETALSLYSPVLHPHFRFQDPALMCMAYSSWALWELGRPDAALARIKQAVGMASEFQHRYSQGVTMAYGVSIELLRGETQAALERAEACARLCEDSGFPVWLAITQCMRGYLLCELDRFDEGLPEMRRGHEKWLATGSMVSQPLYLMLQVEGLLRAGELDEAAGHVDRGLAIVQRYGERQLEAELTRLRGELALRRGRSEEGEAWLARAYVLALRRGRLGFALRSASALARHWAATGRRERALRLLKPLVGRWTEGRSTRDVRVAAALVEELS